MSNWIFIFFLELINKMSPELRAAIKNFILELEKSAEKTKSPYDDLLVKFLKGMLAL